MLFLLKTLKSYAPLRSEELRKAQFARMINASDGLSSGMEFGFNFTSGMQTQSVTNNRPEGFNYGVWLHENTGWTPVIAGVGDHWVMKAWNDTQGRRKKAIREFR